jgi:hypothetical protein
MTDFVEEEAMRANRRAAITKGISYGVIDQGEVLFLVVFLQRGDGLISRHLFSFIH